MSSYPMAVSEDELILLSFFEDLFEHDEGYLSICTTRPPARRDTFHEEYFQWPKDKNKAIEYIDRVRHTHNVYFCVNILSAPRRTKDNAIPQNLVWADLDTCRPDEVHIPPQVVIESSPNRFQAIWKLDSKVDPRIAENYSKRLAYQYADRGADKSGHDLTQLLRVPDTYNFKYQIDDAPVVRLLTNIEGTLPISIFDELPQTDEYADLPDIEIPKLADLPDPDMILYRHDERIKVLGFGNAFARYYSQEPPSDWSGHLWRLILLCLEIGMTAEETFVIAKTSKCNKYDRDGRPESHLWREVLKAELQKKNIDTILQEHRYLVMPPLVTQKEVDALQPTLIDTYKGWATEATDAVDEFHEISCAMLMSSLMSTTLRLPIAGNRHIVPNLWAMILGESTLTRKTTAMDMAMDFIMDIDSDLVLGSDATQEGLFSALALRPKMVSIFYRDEISGFFDALRRKEYMTGMHEAMTKLYDVPRHLKRVLKKDTYVVSEPIFIFFGGGVPDKIYSLIDETYFMSGFIPRFLVMRGYPDIERIRPTGPPIETGNRKRDALKSTFQAFYTMYTDQQIDIQLHDGQHMRTTPEIQVTFTPEMWQRAATIEKDLTIAASESPEDAKALPMFSRMFTSMLKLTMLLAAARQEPHEYKVEASMTDLLTAAYYIERWGRHSVDLIRNSGVSADESKMMSVYRQIERQPGVYRSEIMQRHRLNARDMDLIETTLLQRSMLHIQTHGRTKSYWPMGR